MILQIERKGKITYVDGITSINVYHKQYVKDKHYTDGDHTNTDYYAFDNTKGTDGWKWRGVGEDGRKIRLFVCCDAVKNREWYIVTDCNCYLLNNEGKTIARYAENTLN